MPQSAFEAIKTVWKETSEFTKWMAKIKKRIFIFIYFAKDIWPRGQCVAFEMKFDIYSECDLFIGYLLYAENPPRMMDTTPEQPLKMRSSKAGWHPAVCKQVWHPVRTPATANSTSARSPAKALGSHPCNGSNSKTMSVLRLITKVKRQSKIGRGNKPIKVWIRVSRNVRRVLIAVTCPLNNPVIRSCRTPPISLPIAPPPPPPPLHGTCSLCLLASACWRNANGNCYATKLNCPRKKTAMTHRNQTDGDEQWHEYQWNFHFGYRVQRNVVWENYDNINAQTECRTILYRKVRRNFTTHESCCMSEMPNNKKKLLNNFHFLSIGHGIMSNFEIDLKRK